MELDGWPMAAANPQRTSWVEEDLGDQLSSMDVEWYRPIEAYIPQNVNLIASHGMIYVSTARGLYALDSDTGETVWRFDTEMPLGNAPTVIEGVAYVGGYDRKLHALNAYTGEHLWSFNSAQAGYDTNPLVIKDDYTGGYPVVFLGNRDGAFYAIGGHGHPQQGRQLWRYQTGGPIHFSAAYNQGVVFFASDDNYAYALSANGNFRWKSAQLLGDGFHSFWPVIYGDKVVFSAATGYRFGSNPGSNSFRQPNGEYLDRHTAMDSLGIFEGNVSGLQLPDLPPQTWSNGLPVVDASAITEYHENNPSSDPYKHKPWRRLTFALNQSNGREYTFDSDGDGHQEYIPIPRHGTRQGNNYPPIVSPDGVLYSAVMYTIGTETHSYVMGWREGTQYFSLLGGTSRSALVEPHAISAGGDHIFRNLCCDRVGAFFSYLSGRPSGTFWSYNLYQHAPDYDSMWSLASGSGRGDRLRGWFSSNTGSENGIYHNHGDQNPLIPYQGRLYTHRSNAIIALGTAGSARRISPLRAINESSSPVAPDQSSLHNLLEREIQKMLDAGHLRPGYFNHQLGNNWEFNDYFHNPGDTLFSLSIAYPFLSSEMQDDVAGYLRREFDDYFNPTMYATIGWIDGSAREWMPLPPEVQWRIENPDPDDSNDRALYPRQNDLRAPWNYPPHNFYALFKYVENIPTTDRDSNEVIYILAKSKINGTLSSSRGMTNEDFIRNAHAHNAYITGYIGYLKLQQVVGYDQYLQEEVQAELDRLLDLRWQLFDKDTPWVDRDVYYKKMMDIARNFLYLSPELAEYYRDNIRQDVEEAVADYEIVAPYWFVSRFESVVGEGVMQNLYNSPSLFQAKAWILQEPADELYKNLDVPAFKVGDLFYIQNLVVLLDIMSDLPDAPPPTITPDGGSFDLPVTIELSSALPDAEIRYTLDGSDPAFFSTLYTEPFTLYGSTIVKARAYHPDHNPSPIASATFELMTVFEDVPFDHWAYDYIEALYESGYVVGCSTDPMLYCPDDTLNRAESAVFTLRGDYGAVDDPPYSPPSTPTFYDVLDTHWGFGWIESLWTDGYTAGCDTDPLLYCPDQTHTRGEGSVFFLRAKNGFDYDPPPADGIFEDVEPDAWYADWVEAAYNQGLLPACETDPLRFCPDDLLDRAWAAYMMVQAKGGLEAIRRTTETSTPTPTYLASPSITPTPTPTNSSTPTATAGLSETATQSPTNTIQPTPTPSPSGTPFPTGTATPTEVPDATVTPTP